MLTNLHSPLGGKLRVVGYASGSGNTLWKAYELQKEMEQTPEGCPFEIVGLFSDNPASRSVEGAKHFGLPWAAIDIREYYKQRGKPLRDREVRAQYDREALDLIRPFGADLILLAGYVWATTDAILDEYTLINVHPADLSILKEGKRAYAGANGVGDALAAREPSIAATAHLATRELDGGPILMISEQVPVDYSLHSDETERMRHYLKLVNHQNRLVGARSLLEVALGRYCLDERGNLYYKGAPVPQGVSVRSWEENKPLYQRNTGKLLHPDSIAVIGASAKPGLGKSVVDNLLRDGYTGAVYAVNVRGEAVGNAPGFVSVKDIPGQVDLAVVSVPSQAVLPVVQECGEKGVQALVCISAGFGELGDEGRKAQSSLNALVDRYNMRMIGPNCMGLMNAAAGMNATMLASQIVKGSVAMVTQSGAIGAAMLDFAGELGLGFSAIVSLGNQADINICDLLPLLEDDPATKVVALYLESIPDPARFCALASKMAKPIIAVKAGATSAGASAASSHTGSLAGNDKIVDALLTKAGVIRVETLEDCFLCAAALSKMPRVAGNRVGVLTNAGGPGILISDMLSKQGFEVPRLSEGVAAALAPQLFAESSLQNPVDIIAAARPEHYAAAAEAMLASGEFDALIVCCVPPATVDTGKVATALLPLLEGASIPVLTSFFGPHLCHAAKQVLLPSGVPTFPYPEQTAAVLSHMRQKRPLVATGAARPDSLAVHRAKEILHRTEPGAFLPLQDAYDLLRQFDIGVPGSGMVKTAEEAGALPLSYPVVAKIDHPEIVHKSDVGGVKVGIASSGELEAVVASMLERFPGANGVLVQEMVPEGLEIIVGCADDPHLGKAVMVGLGGIWVEIMRDVAFGYPPIGRADALQMLDSLKIKPLLEGYRGKPGVDLDALCNTLERVSTLLLAVPEIAELDLNPILYDAGKQKFVAADARIRRG